MRGILGVIVFTLAMTACGCSSGPTDVRGDTDAYLATLRDEGGISASSWSDDELVAAGKLLCSHLINRPKMDQYQAALWLMDSNKPRLSSDQAGSVIGAAVTVYCPEQAGQVGVDIR